MKKIILSILLGAFAAGSPLEARYKHQSVEDQNKSQAELAQERKLRRDRIAQIEAKENEEENRTT